ncbi:hypothetical protein [Streptomyces sp. NPDC002490]
MADRGEGAQRLASRAGRRAGPRQGIGSVTRTVLHLAAAPVAVVLRE